MATRSRYGPVRPKSVIDTTTRAGFACSSAADVNAWVSGCSRLNDSNRMSASAARSSNADRPAGSSRSRTTPNLLALRSANPKSSRRPGEPPGGSMRMTSAPRSARIRPHHSAASSVRSRTRNVLSGKRDSEMWDIWDIGGLMSRRSLSVALNPERGKKPRAQDAALRDPGRRQPSSGCRGLRPTICLMLVGLSVWGNKPVCRRAGVKGCRHCPAKRWTRRDRRARRSSATARPREPDWWRCRGSGVRLRSPDSCHG